VFKSWRKEKKKWFKRRSVGASALIPLMELSWSFLAYLFSNTFYVSFKKFKLNPVGMLEKFSEWSGIMGSDAVFENEKTIKRIRKDHSFAGNSTKNINSELIEIF
jgi:hypothetical protein